MTIDESVIVSPFNSMKGNFPVKANVNKKKKKTNAWTGYPETEPFGPELNVVRGS
jgi:hypothetical protein